MCYECNAVNVITYDAVLIFYIPNMFSEEVKVGEQNTLRCSGIINSSL